MQSNITKTNIEDVLTSLFKSLEDIKQRYLNKENEVVERQDKTKFQKNIIEKELEVALKKFDLKEAKHLAKKLDELVAFEDNSVVSQKFENEQMQREMAYEAFFVLKNMPKSLVQQVLQDQSKLSDFLGEWFSALKLWLNNGRANS